MKQRLIHIAVDRDITLSMFMLFDKCFIFGSVAHEDTLSNSYNRVGPHPPMFRREKVVF